MKTVESPEIRSTQVDARESFDRSALPSSWRLSGAVYPSLVAINTAWADFINRRLKENLTLPEQLGDCENLSSVLRVYGAYCRAAAAQYQAVFAHLQLIGLNLASDISATALVPMRISATQHRHIARSPDRAARGCFP